MFLLLENFYDSEMHVTSIFFIIFIFNKFANKDTDICVFKEIIYFAKTLHFVSVSLIDNKTKFANYLQTSS